MFECNYCWDFRWRIQYWSGPTHWIRATTQVSFDTIFSSKRLSYYIFLNNYSSILMWDIFNSLEEPLLVPSSSWTGLWYYCWDFSRSLQHWSGSTNWTRATIQVSLDNVFTQHRKTLSIRGNITCLEWNLWFSEGAMSNLITIPLNTLTKKKMML